MIGIRRYHTYSLGLSREANPYRRNDGYASAQYIGSLVTGISCHKLTGD